MIREYIVTKDILNIRSKPSDESDFKGELKLNTTVWLDDKEIIGTIPTGGTTNIWLLYNTNKFVSKDGLGFSAQEYIDERFDGASFKEAIDYNFLLNIPQQIKQSNEKDCIIGILDQPISTNINFENIVRPGNILTNISPTNHGNFISGIIGAKSTTNINGICSKGAVIDLTYKDISGALITDDDYYNNLIDHIKSFGNRKIIINVSRSLDASLKFAINKFKDLSNVIFVCSAGTDSELLNINNMALKGSPNTISVGVASLDFLNSNALEFDKNLDVILPIFNYVSFNNDGLTFSKIPDSSGSWGTAVVSCIVSLLYSSNTLTNDSTKNEIILKIQDLAKDHSNSYNFLNPLKFLK